MSELERIERRLIELEHLAREAQERQRRMEVALVANYRLLQQILEILQEPKTYPASVAATIANS